MRRAIFALATCLSCVGAPAWGDGASSFLSDHFDYCAPPVRPACIDNPKTFQDGGSTSGCSKDMERFISSVYKYRDCVYRRLERVLQNTNAASDLFKCRAAHQPKCS